MLSTPSPSPGRSRPRRLALVTTTLAVLLGMQPAATAGTADDPGGPTAVAAGTSTVPSTGAGRTYPVTLITGDVAVLHVAPDGSQAAWLEQPADDDPGRPARPPRIVELDGQVHVVPFEAEPYLAAGVLDERLFNLTYLARVGYDDTSRSDLPLLLGDADVADLPDGATTVRRLDSIDAVSVTVPKRRTRDLWESLRGPDPATPGTRDARLAGAGRVWLNGRVEAALDGSVPHVGAPTAWQTGLDGTGVRVAVLDTGYDPTHPDLVGQVVAARDFTDADEPVDGNGHGTHVAATIAGTGAASGGARTGVAPGADLVIGKVLDDGGNGFDDWIIAGLEWAVAQDARIVNLSLGTTWASDGTDPLSVAVDRLTEESGALFVVAAGNLGPSEGTVTSPGAATRALTVGATTKDDGATEFSSRGPRLGDGAVKPEIVAPGADIVAARAAGTSAGNLIDERYTSLSGTSMATPHVAGAAAIVAQQHPDWTADQIKARLVSTSSPLPDLPVAFSGGGRLDVAAAVREPVSVSEGALSFGKARHDADDLTRTLTYRNASDRPLLLRLSADVTGTGTRDRTPALRIVPGAVLVPPGGEATATVTLSPRATVPGSYAGHIVARDQRGSGASVRTVVSATVEGPLRTITVTGIDREGGPASGPVQMWNADTGEMYSGFLLEGTATIQVPDGLYTLLATLESGGWPPTSLTVAGDPELTVRRDLTVTYDARDAEPVRVTTPRDTVADQFTVTWQRRAGDRTASGVVADGWGGMGLYLLPGPRARTGTFELTTFWQLVQPLLTVGYDDPTGRRVDLYPSLATPDARYAGRTVLPVVDVGLGTPEEFAAVDVAGKVALVTRRDGFDELAEQAKAAREAGAALLLAHDNSPGLWREELYEIDVPAYTMDQQAGEALRRALAADPDLTLDLSAVTDATYSYHLVFTAHGSVPAGGDHDADDHPTAVVTSDYRENSARMGRREMWIPYPDHGGLANGLTLIRGGPVVRTEYVSAEGVRWQRFGWPYRESPSIYWTWSPLRRYQSGSAHEQLWWGPLTRPGVPEVTGAEEAGLPVARFHDAIRIVIPHYLYGAGTAYGTIFMQTGDESRLTLSRDGEVVGTAPWPEAQFTVPAAEDWYELRLEVTNGPGNFMDTSVRTDSTWRFRSGRPAQHREVLPLVQVDYGLDTDPFNRVAPGHTYPLRLRPGYQPGAEGPGGFTVSVEVSYDGGDTWLPAPVGWAGEAATAQVPAAPAEAAHATVRVVATDAAGNRLTQVIERAWLIG